MAQQLPWTMVPPSASVDSFSRQRVSEPKVLFNSDFAYDTNPLFFSSIVVGTGSAVKTAGESSITLSTGGAGAGAGVTFSSKQYFRYEPGKGRFVVLSGILGAQAAGVTSRFGNYDAKNGMFLEMDGTLGASVNQRSDTSGTPVDEKILQASWNIDKMDGSGPSGITLHWDKTLVFWIDFQWLGSGRARFGFIVNGMSQAVHDIYNDNFLTVPYMNQGDLPARQEIYNTGAASGAATSKVIVMVVINEGSPELAPSFIRFTANNASNTVAASGPTPVVSIRPALLFAGNTNRMHNLLELLGVACVGGNSAFYQLIYNGVLTGADFAPVDSHSGMTYDLSATAISGGTILASGYATSGQQMISDMLENVVVPFTLDITGTIADTFTIVCTSVPTSAAVTASSIMGNSAAWDAVALVELVSTSPGIAAVGGATNAAATNVTTLSVAYAPTAGNTAVVMFQTSNTVTGLTVKDNLGNALSAGATIGELAAYYQYPVPAGVTSYIATWTTARHAGIAVEEYANVQGVNPRPVPSTASGTSALATITTALLAADDWVVVGFGNVSSQTMTGTVGTQRQQILGSATSAPITLMDATAVVGVANVVAKIAWFELR